MGAADRAARQVERLLAFSRRQRLAPEVVDINALAAGMLDLLQVSLGERIDLRTALAPHLPAVRVDPGQLENALMNLALNARDAMPDGGTLRIDTTGTGDGTVEIAVTDTGSGIPPAVIERVCEPFFTTKPRGKGSGLGLSMVYGFARQSGGDMEIDSTPGLGTRVRIRLPVADGRPQAARAPDETADGATAGEAPRGHGETLLVVDDDPDVLGSTAAGLRALGYRVLTAGNPAEALAHLDREPDIRVLYTDVCMPNPGDGARLARAALARSPGLALLYTSGAVQTVDDPDAGLLAKPVALTTLAHRLRQLLQPAAG
jgi:CheY-like chemotaxis protein